MGIILVVLPMAVRSRLGELTTKLLSCESADLTSFSCGRRSGDGRDRAVAVPPPEEAAAEAAEAAEAEADDADNEEDASEAPALLSAPVVVPRVARVARVALAAVEGAEPEDEERSSAVVEAVSSGWRKGSTAFRPCSALQRSAPTARAMTSSDTPMRSCSSTLSALRDADVASLRVCRRPFLASRGRVARILIKRRFLIFQKTTYIISFFSKKDPICGVSSENGRRLYIHVHVPRTAQFFKRPLRYAYGGAARGGGGGDNRTKNGVPSTVNSITINILYSTRYCTVSQHNNNTVYNNIQYHTSNSE